MTCLNYAIHINDKSKKINALLTFSWQENKNLCANDQRLANNTYIGPDVFKYLSFTMYCSTGVGSGNARVQCVRACGEVFCIEFSSFLLTLPFTILCRLLTCILFFSDSERTSFLFPRTRIFLIAAYFLFRHSLALISFFINCSYFCTCALGAVYSVMDFIFLFIHLLYDLIHLLWYCSSEASTSTSLAWSWFIYIDSCI